MNSQHITVLLNEAVAGLNIDPNGIYLDGTLGGAGHSLEIAKLLNEQGTLIGVDRDMEAIEASSKRLKDVLPKVRLVNDNYRNILYVSFRASAINEHGIYTFGSIRYCFVESYFIKSFWRK